VAGIVIAFPRHGTGTRSVCHSRQKRSSQIMARVDRIALLLAELDNLMPLSAEASARLTQALATISEVEKLAKRGSARPSRSAVDGDGDLQPHVDHDALKGYFQSLSR